MTFSVHCIDVKGSPLKLAACKNCQLEKNVKLVSLQSLAVSGHVL